MCLCVVLNERESKLAVVCAVLRYFPVREKNNKRGIAASNVLPDDIFKNNNFYFTKCMLSAHIQTHTSRMHLLYVFLLQVPYRRRWPLEPKRHVVDHRSQEEHLQACHRRVRGRRASRGTAPHAHIRAHTHASTHTRAHTRKHTYTPK